MIEMLDERDYTLQEWYRQNVSRLFKALFASSMVNNCLFPVDLPRQRHVVQQRHLVLGDDNWLVKLLVSLSHARFGGGWHYFNAE